MIGSHFEPELAVLRPARSVIVIFTSLAIIALLLASNALRMLPEAGPIFTTRQLPSERLQYLRFE